MINRNFVLSGLALVGLAMASGTALAAESDPGFYIGGGLGEANLEIDDVGFDDSDTAFKLFGGYRFNEYFGIELAYFDGGEIEDGQDGLPGTVIVEPTGVNLSAVVTAPFDNFSLFAKLGYASLDFDTSVRFLGQRFSVDSGSEEELSYGAGAAYSFNESFSLRAEYEAFDIDDADADLLTLNAVFRF